ncbi:hypothetical protein [Sphingomonas sp. CFBP 8764]|jgi:hypothetical protein|uniref:hypothetical protein n=1 Tax=Sphingomonas sp. CFBP 8764 TaxID=2775275 RepID=UPI00177D19A8|nr:hypothetical protein [Sphingomonas sp. CFBP 8764]MBD8549500.1 hypothetical protein [Sphingomonas sp. CFBP 8764]
MAKLPFLVMSDLQAARFREETATDQNRLDPRLIDAGPYRGQYVLPERVMMDPAHISHRDAFRMLTVVSVDVEVAWPSVDE